MALYYEFFIAYNISHMNDKNISHQRFTVVVLCSKSAHSVYWLFLIFIYIFFNNLNEYLIDLHPGGLAVSYLSLTHTERFVVYDSLQLH